MRISEWVVGLVFVGVLAVLPFAGHSARRDATQSCAYNGTAIEPLYRVRVVDCCGRDHAFCCIACAEQWLRKEKMQPRAIYVTDEVGGEEIEAASANYVRSLVVTNRITGNRIHAFRDMRDATEHARSPGSHILEGDARPFAGQGCPACNDCCTEP